MILHRIRNESLVAFFLGVLAGAAAAETLRLRADSWMPFNGDPAAEQPGLAVEVVRAIFVPRGIAVDYQTMSWPASLAAAVAGEIEGVIGANTKETAGLVRPAEAIGLPRIGFFVRKGSTWRFANVPALRSIRMGALEAYSYWDTLDRYIEAHVGAEVIMYAGEGGLNRAIADLDAGRIDVMPETAAVFIWNLKTAGRQPADFPIVYLHEGDPIFVAFTAMGDAGHRYARIFDQGMMELRRSGEFTRLLQRYSLTDWK